MDASKPVPDARHRDPSDPVLSSAFAMTKPADQQRVGCSGVARNRAARYARKRRIPKPLWPLISAAILVGLIFERRPPPTLSWAVGRLPATDRTKDTAVPLPEPEATQNEDMFVDAADTSAPEPQYLPPAQFLAKDAAQLVDFLVRNRGRLDNELVRAKWKIVDRFSLPLAIYLREIEANATWDDLEKEISAVPPGSPATFPAQIPKSPRHRKILRLLPEWTRRGEEFISPVPIGDSTLTPTPDGGDEPGTKPPKL